MNKNVNYGNWVPEKMLALCYVAAAVLGIAAYVTGPWLNILTYNGTIAEKHNI